MLGSFFNNDCYFKLWKCAEFGEGWLMVISSSFLGKEEGNSTFNNDCYFKCDYYYSFGAIDLA